jgi:hypothetical protein
MNEKQTSRRRFLKTTAGTAALGYAGISDAASINKDNPFLRIGVVGLEVTTRACEMARAIDAKAAAFEKGMQITAVGIDQSGANLSRAQETLRTLGVTTMVHQPEDLIPHIDCAAIFGTNNTSRYAKSLIDAGKPLYIALPAARNMKEANELLAYAKQKNVPVISGGPLSMMSEVVGAAVQIDRSIIQQYYLHGQADTWYGSMANMIDMAGALIGNDIVRCATHGDIESNAAVITTVEHEPIDSRDPVIGSMLTFREKHDRYWLKVHMDNDVIENGIFAEPGKAHYFDRVWFPFLDAVESTFRTGKEIMSADSILNSTAAIIMAYESARSNGKPVGIGDIDHVTLQDSV